MHPCKHTPFLIWQHIKAYCFVGHISSWDVVAFLEDTCFSWGKINSIFTNLLVRQLQSLEDISNSCIKLYLFSFVWVSISRIAELNSLIIDA